jgi:hypothetical protein
MPRVPLSSIGGNSRRGKELTPYIRGKIDGKHKSGYRPAEIARDLHISENTVRSTLDLSSKCYNREFLSRSEHPSLVSRRDE